MLKTIKSQIKLKLEYILLFLIMTFSVVKYNNTILKDNQYFLIVFCLWIIIYIKSLNTYDHFYSVLRLSIFSMPLSFVNVAVSNEIPTYLTWYNFFQLFLLIKYLFIKDKKIKNTDVSMKPGPSPLYK